MRSLRWKLMLVTMAAVFVPLYLLNRYAVAEFDRFTRRTWEDQMIDVGVVVGELFTSTLDASDDPAFGRFRSLCDTVGAETGCRIQVLWPGGSAFHDTARRDDAEVPPRSEELV